MQEIGIESTLVEAIKQGDKTIEARLGTPKYLTIEEGDVVSVREDFWHEGKILESLPQALQIRITQILYFETFKEALTAVDFQAVLPVAKDLDDAITTHKQFYSSKDEREYGVVIFTFELVA